MTSRTILAFVIVGVLAFSARADNTLYLKNGRSLSAKTLEWKEGAQEYVITSGDTTMPIPRAQVARVSVDKPADFDQAAAMVKSRQYTQAIPILEGIVKKYRMLNWDVEAGKLLSQAYLETHDAKKAVAAMEALFSVVGRDQVSPSLQRMYWKALFSSGANAQLRKELDKVIGTGTLEMVGAAYLQRGNMFLKMGEDEDALSDFIKITTLFQNQKAIQPESLFLAAELLDKARDPRGAEFRKKLALDYPGNEFTLKAATKAPPPSTAASVPVPVNPVPTKPLAPAPTKKP